MPGPRRHDLGDPSADPGDNGPATAPAARRVIVRTCMKIFNRMTFNLFSSMPCFRTRCGWRIG